VRITDTADLWWKTAVVYCLDVETFFDSDGDGTGRPGRAGPADRLPGRPRRDLPVADARLPDPDRDDGYDIVDFYGVDKRLGNLGDFVEVIRTAKDRGMRVIADLVVNHTSDQHPWFKASRSSKDSPYRDWYVWSDEPTPVKDGVVFPDQETSVWELDEKTGQYYLHQFYKHQPT
jgi:glycosidase